MKIIIKEDQINRLIFSFLDDKSKDWYFWDIGDGEFTIDEGGTDLIKYRVEVETDNGYLLLNPDLIMITDTMFNLTAGSSAKVIMDWVNDRYDANANNWAYFMKYE